MKRLLMITVGLAFTLGAVYPAFTQDEKLTEKKEGKKKGKKKKGGETKEGPGPSTPALFAVSGSVTGVQAGPILTLRLAGPVTRSIEIRQSGGWSVPGLPAGTYTVSLSSPSYNVTPPSRQAVIQAANIVGINFQVSMKAPPPPATKKAKPI